jgi:hypothetical protein
MTNARAVAAWRALLIIGAVNFLVFLAVSFAIGGVAHGWHEPSDGRYYVANKGKVREVSRGVWLYSRAHSASLFLTHPVLIVAIVMHHRERRQGKVAVGRKWV